MRRLLFVFFFMGLFLPASFAAIGSAQPPEVAAVEAYLNGITTLKAHFIQTANDGQQTEGTFLLKRTGKMRFEYAPPVTDFIVADGMFIYYYDGQMKQQSNVPISKSLADFFLRENLKMSGDVEVADIQRKGGFLQLTLVQSRESLAGSLTLMLTEKPMQLKKWSIVDAQGLVTEVELTDVETGIVLKDKLFYYHDPKRKNPVYNQN